MTNWLSESIVKSADDIQEEIAESKRHLLKQQRDENLDSLVCDLGNGRIIQIRPSDHLMMRSAIDRGQSVDWIMADNSIARLSVDDLKKALLESFNAIDAVFKDYCSKIDQLQRELDEIKSNN